MADPAWPCATPEANYFRLVGPGAAGTTTTLASGSAWQALMGSTELALSMSTLNTAVTATNFEGVGGLNSSATVGELNTALQLLAGWTQEKPPIAASAVAAYQAAVSSMIPAEVSVANRSEQAANVAINPAVFGALTPAIVALDTEYYGEHWPHNAAAGAAYGAALTALIAALAIPPPIAGLGASPLAPVTAAEAVAQAVGVASVSGALDGSSQLTKAAATPVQAAADGGQLSSMAMQPMQAAMGAMQPMLGMFSAPLQAFQGLAGLPQSMLGSLGGMFNGMKAGDATVPGGELARANGPFGSVGGSSGGGSSGGGGYPGAGLTSYTRPTNSFAPESAGRPVGLKGGLLSSEFRGPAASIPGGGAMPLSPGSAGMLGQQRASGEGGKNEAIHARIALPDGRLSDEARE